MSTDSMLPVAALRTVAISLRIGFRVHSPPVRLLRSAASTVRSGDAGLFFASESTGGILAVTAAMASRKFRSMRESRILACSYEINRQRSTAVWESSLQLRVL